MKRRATLPNPMRTSDSSGWFMKRVQRRYQCGQQIAQSVESGAVVFGRLAEAETQIAVHAEMIAGHDQHALLLAQAGREFGGIDLVVVAHVDNRAGFGPDPVETAGIMQPRFD